MVDVAAATFDSECVAISPLLPPQKTKSQLQSPHPSGTRGAFRSMVCWMAPQCLPLWPWLWPRLVCCLAIRSSKSHGSLGTGTWNTASNSSHISGFESVPSAYHRFRSVCAPLEEKSLKMERKYERNRMNPAVSFSLLPAKRSGLWLIRGGTLLL